MGTFAHPLLSTLPCVLVIGNDSKARAQLHRILLHARFRTFVCAQFRDAVELMQFVSVILCHQPLTDLHWKDVLRQAETLREAPSVIVTVPRTTPQDLEDAYQAGVFALPVPYRDTELITLVRRAHTEYRTVRQLQSAHLTGLERFGPLPTPTATKQSEIQDSSKWTKSSSAARFQAPNPTQRELIANPAKSVTAS